MDETKHEQHKKRKRSGELLRMRRKHFGNFQYLVRQSRSRFCPSTTRMMLNLAGPNFVGHEYGSSDAFVDQELTHVSHTELRNQHRSDGSPTDDTLDA